MNTVREYGRFRVLSDGDIYYILSDGVTRSSPFSRNAAFNLFEDVVLIDLDKFGQYKTIQDKKFYIVNVHDFLMLLNFKKNSSMMSSHILKYGVYEGPETAFIKSVVKPGMVCMDVGAHIGYHTLLLSTIVGKKGHVYSFEVDKNLLEVLVENISLNRLHNISSYGFALSDNDGESKYISGGSIMSNDNNGIKCVSMTANSFVDKYRCHIDFAKIDTSGYDCKVLAGMGSVIDRNPNIVIMMEYNPSLFALFGNTNDDLLRMLSEYDLSAVFLTGDRAVERFGFGLFNPIEPKIYHELSMDKITKEYSSDPEREVLSIVCAKYDVLRKIFGGAEVAC